MNEEDAATQVGYAKDYNPLQIVCFLTILEIAEKNKADCIRNSYVGGGKTAFETHGLFFFSFDDALTALRYYICSLLGATINHQMHIPH